MQKQFRRRLRKMFLLLAAAVSALGIGWYGGVRSVRGMAARRTTFLAMVNPEEKAFRPANFVGADVQLDDADALRNFCEGRASEIIMLEELSYRAGNRHYFLVTLTEQDGVSRNYVLCVQINSWVYGMFKSLQQKFALDKLLR